MIKRQHKQEYFIIPYVIFPFDVLVSFHKSIDDLELQLKKILPNVCDEFIEISELADAHTVMYSSGQTVIWYGKLTHGIISHEIFHAVDFLMKRINYKLSDDNDEIYAYLIQYLTNKIYEKL